MQQSYIIILTIIGLAALGMAWMPAISQRTQISYSIIYMAAGMLLYLLFGNLLPLPLPLYESELTLRLTELVVIISLMGSGLKIDQPFSFRNWGVPFRLVSLTMMLSILVVTLAGIWVLGLDLPSALLLGAVLAPTDPVLASDVQVGPPLEDVHDNIKFSLTAEAGMNDGTAFPFTWLAILLAGSVSGSEPLAEWFWNHLLLKIVIGVACGWLLGKGVAYIIFRLPEKADIGRMRDGFVAISITLLVYGLTELAHGYGFIAVFVCAITIRNYEIDHKYHKKMHSFTDQIERILVAVVLLLFGGSLVKGVLNHLTWTSAIFAFVFVLLVRPLTSLIGMLGTRTRLHLKERLAISFFGIKGMGSFFYLAFALNATHFRYQEALWSIGAFVVLLSIIIHGLTATPIMRQLDHEFNEPVKKPETEAGG